MNAMTDDLKEVRRRADELGQITVRRQELSGRLQAALVRVDRARGRRGRDELVDAAQADLSQTRVNQVLGGAELERRRYELTEAVHQSLRTDHPWLGAEDLPHSDVEGASVSVCIHDAPL